MQIEMNRYIFLSVQQLLQIATLKCKSRRETGLLNTSLGGVGRRHEVAAVLDDAGRGDAPLHHLGGELVVVAEVGEADDVVARLAVLDEHDGGDDPDLQPLRQEGALLGVYLDELGLQVPLGQDPEVLVHNLGRDRHLAFWVLGDLTRGIIPSI